MATAAREKTKYPGVTFLTTSNGEKIFYIRYRLPGDKNQTEEKAGKSSQGMTAAKAANIRGERMEGKAPTNSQKRTIEKTHNEEWTIIKLFEKYIKSFPSDRNSKSDYSNFKHLSDLHNRTTDGIATEDVEKIKKKLENKSQQTIKHVVVLLSRIISYAVKNGIIDQPSTKKLRLIKPRVDNKKTEYLDDDKQQKLTETLESEEGIHREGAIYMHIIMLTGIRKSAALALRWEDIDTKLKIIRLRGKEAKKDITDYIPLTEEVEELIGKLNKTDSPFLFPSPEFPDRHRESFTRAIRKFRKLANLDKDFRPLHGLRHNLATKIASSGKVDIYTLQKLLTHDDIESTQRYAHLADEALQRAANVGISEILKKKEGSEN